MVLVCFSILSNGRPTQTCVANAWEMRFWLDPYIGHRILTFHSQRKQCISRSLPAHCPRIKNAFYTVFCSFGRLGRDRPDGHRTCVGNAREMRGKCVCFVICLCLLSVLYGFGVFFHFVKWATYTNMCYKCMGNEILAGPSHRSAFYLHVFRMLFSFISHCVFAASHLPHILFAFPTHFWISPESHFPDTFNALLGFWNMPRVSMDRMS